MNLRTVRVENKTPQALSREFPRGNCKLCGCNFYVSFDYHRMGLCEECARKAGAAFLLSHGGEYHRRLDPEGYARDRADKKRRKLLRPVKQPITADIRLKVFKRDGYACRQCGARDDLEADHVVPEAKGGPATIENLQTLCGWCNRHKGCRDA